MAKKKSAAGKKSTKVLRGDQRMDVAARAAAAVTAAIGKATKGKSGLGKDGKMNVHVHLGDVVMMGFDEAVDAEEWGMRETNNEVVGGARGSKGRAGRARGNEDQEDRERPAKRSIRFRKGTLQLDAVEHSAPARKKAAKKKAAKKATRKRR